MDFIRNYLNVHDKEDLIKGGAVKKRNYVGQGAFGKVLEATSPPITSSPNSPVLARFALKCIHPILKPPRLASELRLLRDLGGQSNVVKMHTAHFDMGQVYILMDMIDHENFSDYVEKLDLNEIIDYMKNLFIALEHVHENNVIHRDIKPSNFLYNRKERTYSLVDFGLAHYMQDHPTVRWSRYKFAQHLQPTPLQHLPMTPPTTPKQANHNFKNSHTVANNHILSNSRHLSRYFVTSPTSRGWSHSFSNKRQSSTQESPPEIDQTFKRLRVNEDLQNNQPKYKPVTPVTPTSRTPAARRITTGPSCECRGLPKVCSICTARPEPLAPKAGTPGYKAPEVLIRWRFQTTALDIWSAGVIFLCLLSGHYPFFRDVDDSTALAEIISLLGSDKVIDAARSIGFKLTIRPKHNPKDLLELCQRIRQSSLKKTQFEIPSAAHDLLIKLLDPNPLTRISAAEALKHPFFEYK